MKFPFVTRARHEAEIAEFKHANAHHRNRSAFSEQRAEELTKFNLALAKQRDEWAEKYRKLLADCRTVMAVNEDLNQRLAPFLRKQGPNGKFISKETKP